jgi:UDP-N-acetylglucosamine/UDP-N-acetylgalactosamine diphosphorylase
METIDVNRVPAELHAKLRQHGQEHVLHWWDQLSVEERRGLVEQLQSVDLAQLRKLHESSGQGPIVPAADRIQPVPVVPVDADPAGPRQLGGQALAAGAVAVLLVAGGQGSRLGFEHPKGMFPVGPVSRKSLFQLHAEKVLALGRRYRRPLPFLIMTSSATHNETEAFFRDNNYFGLSQHDVYFFQQGTMPALDQASGQMLMVSPGQLFLSPNGHGGTLTALETSGLLGQLRERGIRQLFYFQVDNPLVKIADPVFLGQHLHVRSEASSKIIPKLDPKDRVGVFAQVDGRCTIIEYSDLPQKLAEARDETGRLRLWAGSPAIHWFDVDFLARVTQGQGLMPFHIARKKVPHIDASGRQVEPATENAFKFELFVFDALPLAERWLIVETSRRNEFEPLKNATGADSPESVARAISNQAADWLQRAGISVPRTAQGDAAMPIEISPLFALDPEELATRVDRGLRLIGPTYIV